MSKKIFSFDAETDGLWGDVFAIGAIVYENGEKVASFLARMPSEQVKDLYVVQNVLPTLANTPVTHTSYEEMLADFARFYLDHKQDAVCLVHMGYIVKAHLLREMRKLELIGAWDAPYPLYDVSGNLDQNGDNPTSVDDYAKKHKIKINDYGTTHNPLYDSEVAAKVYLHLKK